MMANDSKIGTTPAETSLETDNSEPNIDQLLSTKIITTQQPLIQFNMANMIPSQTPTIPKHKVSDNLTSRQQARRRQPQRRNQRRREQREELQRQQEAQRRQQQEQRRQQQEQRLRGREKNRRQYERWQERRQQQLEQEQKDRRERINNMRQLFNSFKQHIYRTYKEKFFDAYDLENMYTMEWLKHRHVHDRETFPTSKQFELLEDEIEQLRQIDTAEKLQDEEKEERNNQELAHLEQFEPFEFLAEQVQ